jgi:hypothetical protein
MRQKGRQKGLAASKISVFIWHLRESAGLLLPGSHRAEIQPTREI